MNDQELDPIAVDKDISRGASALRGWRRLLRTDVEQAAQEAWFDGARSVTTRTSFRWACSLGSGDPLREPLRRWIYVLAVWRIAQPFVARVERMRQACRIRLEDPEVAVASCRDILHRALADPIPERKGRWIDALGKHAGAVASAEKDLAAAVDEISSRLGVADPRELCVACEPDVVVEQARELLRRTDDLARELFAPARTFAGLLERLVARDVPGIWPARLTAGWLGDLFRKTALLEGVAIDLGPLPPTIGASSFMRGLGRFGAAYARAATERSGLFVLHNDAAEGHPQRRGALFASLLCDPVFLRKKLGFSREVSQSVSRALARTALAAARLEATRCTVELAKAPGSEVQEAVEAAFWVPVPRSLSGTLPRPRQGALSRLAATLRTAVDREELVQRFDEDWFDNPRAIATLREEDAGPRRAAVSSAELSESVRRFAGALERLASG